MLELFCALIMQVTIFIYTCVKIHRIIYPPHQKSPFDKLKKKKPKNLSPSFCTRSAGPSLPLVIHPAPSQHSGPPDRSQTLHGHFRISACGHTHLCPPTSLHTQLSWRTNGHPYCSGVAHWHLLQVGCPCTHSLDFGSPSEVLTALPTAPACWSSLPASRKFRKSCFHSSLAALIGSPQVV